MKSLFYAAGCGLALSIGSAFAQGSVLDELNVKVSGYGEFVVGYGHSDTGNIPAVSFNGVDVKQDVEIHFIPSIKLKNGLTVGANIQLEGNTSGDQIDESFLFVRGDFGRILLGSENSAGYLLSNEAPNAVFLDPRDLSDFVPFAGAIGVNVGDDLTRGTLGQTRLENGRNNDTQRITYITPRWNGLRAGFSYARDDRQDDNTQVNLARERLTHIIDFGANYRQEIGGVEIELSGRWGFARNQRDRVNPQVWGASAQVEYGGFVVGGSFAEQNNSRREDGIAYDAGVLYKTGPWGFSATYLHGENVDDEQPVPGADEQADYFLIGASYKLAKGVIINGFGGYVTFKEDQGDAGGAGDDVSGFAIGSGIQVKF